MSASFYPATQNYGFRLGKKKNAQVEVEQNIKYDPVKKIIMIKSGGEWISLATLSTNEVVERSMSSIKIPNGEESSCIGYRNETVGFASLAEGKMAKTYLRTQEAFASGGFVKPGDAQVTRFIIKADSEPEKLNELMIDDVERFKMPSQKTSVYLDVKLFIKTLESIPKHYVHKLTVILWFEGKTLKKEILREPNLTEGWRFEISEESDTMSILVSTPVKTRWVGICKTIEISN